MAKIKKRNLDAVKRAPVRRSSYEAPSIFGAKKAVPKEYQTFQKAPKRKGGCLWLLFLLFLATFAGFFYWSKKSNPIVEKSVEFSVEGPDKIISGDQAVYTVKYKNIDSVNLEKVELDVRWPNGFYFDEATIEPHDSNATTWFLEDLSPNQEVVIKIMGQLVGQKDDILSASFNLGYQPENFHSDFKEKQTIETKITDSKISLSILATDKTLSATEQQIQVVFRNLTKELIENLYIDILYPNDFEVKPFNDEGTEDDIKEEIESDFILENNYLKVNLEPEEEKIFSVKGSFAVDSQSEQAIVVEVGNMVDEQFRRLGRAEKNIEVFNPKFDIDFQINGKRGPQTVNWNDDLRYQLEITNYSETDMSDIKIIALVDSEVLDWDSLATIGKYEENKIYWSSTEDESLSSWPAGETKTFTWQVKVTGDPQPARTIENIIKINVEGLSGWEQVTSPVLLTVGESLSFNNGIYWDLGGRRVGSGLLPPQVGEETQYLVVWSLPQATGVFEEVEINTTLPPEVSFIGETDVQEGELEFDLATRGLTWRLSEFNGVILPVTASFIISLKPSIEDRGEVMTLLNTSTVSAQGIEEVIVRSKAMKTSDVMADTSGSIGIVQ